MLNKILSRMNGSAADPAALSAEIDQLDRDRQEIEAKIAALQGDRHSALLDDKPDSVLDKIEREIDRATVRLEKLNLSEGPLRQRLAEARATAQAAAVDRHFAARHDLYGRLRKALLAAAELQAEATALHNSAVAELGDGVAQTRLPKVAFAGFLFPENIAIWSAELDRVFAAMDHQRAPAPADVSDTPVPATRAATRQPEPESLQRNVTLGHRPTNPSLLSSAEPLVNDRTPLAPGEARIEVTRSGWTDADGYQRRRGDVVRLGARLAERAEFSGAIRILELAPPEQRPNERAAP